jgi:L-ascorbate metabolism protein UlaG (beta-lactamase superfamily)
MKTTSAFSGRFRLWMIGMLFAAGVFGPPVYGGAPGRSDQAGGREPLRLEYIANMGVLVSAGSQTVLIDALFDKPNPEYRAPAAEVLDKIIKGEAPYNGADLALVTHNHPDHFDAAAAVRYLEASPKRMMLVPADAVADMGKAAADWKKIEPQIVALDLKVGEKERRVLGGIPVTAFRTLHSGNRESPMNLMYLVGLGGRRVFHEGDSPGNVEEFRGFGLGKEKFDLAVIHYWLPLMPDWAKFLQEEFLADHLALAHLNIRLENDAPGKIDQVRKYYKDVFLLLPGMPVKSFL